MSSGEINSKAVSAVKWAAVGTVTKFGVQLITQVILARLLGPENYGLFAMGLVVLTLSNFLADFGFSWSLVQNQNITQEDVRFAFTWQLITGSAATLALFLLAPWVSEYFKEPRLETIVRWLSLSCVLGAITGPGSALLRRSLDFRWGNIIQISSYVFGYLCVGVPLAFLGAGVWTLVSAWLSQSLSAFIFTMIRSPHSMKPLLWYKGARHSTNMGSTVFVTNLCNWMLNNLDRVFMGRFLNAHAVGIYSVGYNLANTPNSLFLTALQPAFLATGAKLQDNPAKLREAYLSVVATIWIVIAPMFILLAVVANDFVVVLYGTKWTGSGIVLSTLALSMPAYIMWGMSTPILWNTGGKHLESLLQIPILCGAALMYFLFSDHGVMAVALIAAGTMLTRALVVSSFACWRVKVSLTDLMPIFGRGAIIVAITAVGGFAGLWLGHAVSPGSFIPFVLGSALGGALVLVVVFIHPRLLGVKVVGMLGKFSPPIPIRLNTYLRSKVHYGSI
jgi:lipopolysaccharide exporter